jgi:release factor glutamine methyltransferase
MPTDTLPEQYRRGYETFCGLKFEVTPEVLIPRPETEGIIRHVFTPRNLKSLRAGARGGRLRILDVGTGSGNLAVLAARRAFPCWVLATDRCHHALATAVRNARTHRAAGQIRFLRADLLDPLKSTLRRDDPFHIILANLPYVRSGEIEELQPEVRDHEPRLALDGGHDGTDCLRRMLDGYAELLAPGGIFAFEIGYDHGGLVRQMLLERGITRFRIERDDADIERIVLIHG